MSQYRLAAHLAMAVVIYLAMLWVALDLLAPRMAARAEHRGLRNAAALITWLVFVTLVAGSFVAGTRAGYLDNTFPLMEGQFVPPDYWHLTPLWRNWFENLTTRAIRSSRAGGNELARRRRVVAGEPQGAPLASGQRWALHALGFFACLQVALGITTLLTVVWLPVAVMHQAGALCLLTAALVTVHALRD